MARPRSNDPIEPMTLGNMRDNGVRSLAVSCWQCHHRAILSAERWPDDMPVPTFGPRNGNPERPPTSTQTHEPPAK